MSVSKSWSDITILHDKSLVSPSLGVDVGWDPHYCWRQDDDDDNGDDDIYIMMKCLCVCL